MITYISRDAYNLRACHTIVVELNLNLQLEGAVLLQKERSDGES